MELLLVAAVALALGFAACAYRQRHSLNGLRSDLVSRDMKIRDLQSQLDLNERGKPSEPGSLRDDNGYRLRPGHAR